MKTRDSISSKIVQRQKRYTWPRRILRDGLLRPIGFRLIVRPHVLGLEHVPKDGPTLLVMNHIGFVDPVVVLGVVKHRWVIPMSKVENFRTPIIGQLTRLWGAYPVHRDQIDREALQNTLDLLKAGHCVLIAPEGTRQKQMIQAKAGFTYVATKTNAVVVPIGLEYTDRVSSNLKRLKRTDVEVRFGPAFRFKTSGRTHIPRNELDQMTQEAMYQLAKLVGEHRRGYYENLTLATTDTLEFI
ncbi:MAG: hypothetical protein CUN55_02005 [Phototrophicales bacterium]|nr:MAG: hypothetical protein CUN55_02005 [Phototrophicales bacterium]